MTRPDGPSLGEEAPEADVAEQRVPIEPVEPTDEETSTEAARVTTAREWEASEADLIEQAIEVPDDELEFDR